MLSAGRQGGLAVTAVQQEVERRKGHGRVRVEATEEFVEACPRRRGQVAMVCQEPRGLGRIDAPLAPGGEMGRDLPTHPPLEESDD